MGPFGWSEESAPRPVCGGCQGWTSLCSGCWGGVGTECDVIQSACDSVMVSTRTGFQRSKSTLGWSSLVLGGEAKDTESEN